MPTTKPIKNFLSTGIGQFVGLVCQLVIIKILTNVLSIEDFGLFSIIILIPSLIIPIIFCEIVSGFSKYFFDIKKEKIYFNTLLFLLGSFTVFSVLLLSLQSPLTKALNFFSVNLSFYLIYLALINHFLIYLNSLSVSFFKMAYESSWLLFQSILIHTTKTILLIYFYFKSSLNLEIILNLFICGHLFSFLISFIKIVNIEQCQIDKPLIRKLINFSKWLIPGSYFGSIINSSDRFLIKILINYKSVGVYTLGYKISDLLRQFFIQSFSSVLGPAKFDNRLEEDKYNNKMNQLFFIFVLLSTCCGLGLNALAKPAILLLSNSDYLAAVSLIPLLIGAHIAWGTNDFLNTGYIIKGQTQYTTIILVVGASINIVLNVFLIDRLGSLGAAVATVFSYLSILPLSYFYSKKFHSIRFDQKYFYQCLILFFLGASIQSQVSQSMEYLWQAIIINLLILAIIAPVLLYLLPKSVRLQYLSSLKRFRQQ